LLVLQLALFEIFGSQSTGSFSEVCIRFYTHTLQNIIHFLQNNTTSAMFNSSALALPAVATAAAGAAMTSAGFGSSGIVDGSVAAGIQSAIGNVIAGSPFAICQSIGMSGGWVGMLVMGALLTFVSSFM
jgi:hypothetical protein